MGKVDYKCIDRTYNTLQVIEMLNSIQFLKMKKCKYILSYHKSTLATKRFL